jgi:cytochrome c peroxidase
MSQLRVMALAVALVFASPSFSSAQTAAQSNNAELLAKGKALFSDKKLSGTGSLSCATCHPGNGHSDNKTYVGTDVVPDGDPKGRSTPTLWGVGTRSVYAWAGTAPTLEGNIRGIIVNRMKGAEPSPEMLAPLAAYVRSLPVPQSPELLADGTPSQKARAPVKRGFDLFLGEGECGACHVLPSFDKAETEDVGSDGKFKVPALRAVSKTAPYFHDGRYKTLKEAVRYMWSFRAAKSKRPSDPTDTQLNDLVAYLSAL